MGYKSIPRFHPGYGLTPSLIGTITGAPGVAFPHTQLRSGIVRGSVTDFLHQTKPSLGILPQPRVFIAAFMDNMIAQVPFIVKSDFYFFQKFLKFSSQRHFLVTITRINLIIYIGYIILHFM